MPNTEVKLQHAKSSWGIAPCEDRTLPRCYGGLAQLGERLPYKQRVTGSSPVSSILLGRPRGSSFYFRRLSCGYGGTGRRARFRFLCLYDVEVRVLLSALTNRLNYFKKVIDKVGLEE